MNFINLVAIRLVMIKATGHFFLKYFEFILAFLALIWAIYLFVHGFKSTKLDLFTAASVIVAVATVLFGLGQSRLEKERANSKYYLERYMEGTRMVLDRLKDDEPTRRMSWVTAASIANDLSKIEYNITEIPDKEFLAIYQRDWAHTFLKFIHGKEAVYFYGVLDCTGDSEQGKLNFAARKCRKGDGIVVRGLIPQIFCFDIEEVDIAKILRLIDPVFLKEAEVSIFGADGRISLDVLSFNYSVCKSLYAYLFHKRECKKERDTIDGLIFRHPSDKKPLS